MIATSDFRHLNGLHRHQVLLLTSHTAEMQVQDEFTLQLQLKAEHLGRTESGQKRYEYDTCFSSEASQDDVYQETRALIQSAFDGYNVCVFAYGQVGISQLQERSLLKWQTSSR